MSTNWLDDLAPTAGPAPEPPAAFLSALRERRLKRRAWVSGGVAVTLVLVGVAFIPMRKELPPNRLTKQNSTEAQTAVIAIPERPFGTPAGLQIAAFYALSGAADVDQGAAPIDRLTEPPIRGGERWDVEQVRAWVQNSGQGSS